MNVLDRVIASVSPAWGARRVAARATLDQIRGYDAAKTSRRTENWRTSNSSANAEVALAGSRPRDRIRDLVRNDPWAASAVRRSAVAMVGTGIVPQILDKRISESRREAVMKKWRWFVDHCDPEGRLDYYGQQYVGARCLKESGEFLVRIIRHPASSGMTVPLQLQLMEPDYLDSAKNEAAAEGGVIIQGVEFDRHGRRVAYWLFPRHPGENLLWSGFVGAEESVRQSADNYLHVFFQDRPGQVRGVPDLASAVLKIRDIKELDDAKLWQSKIASCLVGVITKSDGPAKSGLSAKTDAGEPMRRMSPGTFLQGQPGDKVEFSSPPQDSAYPEQMRGQLTAVSAAAGLSYEQLTGDLSNLNFSSIKAGRNDHYDLLDVQQHIFFVQQLCVPVWNLFAQYVIAAGDWPATKDLSARHVPPKRRWVDATREVPALKEAVRSGFTSLSEIWVEQGEDPDERMADIQRTNEALDRHGIILDSDPRKSAGIARDVAKPPAEP